MDSKRLNKKPTDGNPNGKLKRDLPQWKTVIEEVAPHTINAKNTLKQKKTPETEIKDQRNERDLTSRVPKSK